MKILPIFSSQHYPVCPQIPFEKICCDCVCYAYSYIRTVVKRFADSADTLNTKKESKLCCEKNY